MFLWTKSINESFLAFSNLLDALGAEAVKTKCSPLLYWFSMLFFLRNPMVSCQFFSQIFADRQNNFLWKKTYSAILPSQKLESNVNKARSDTKQHPYWLPATKNFGRGLQVSFALSIVFLLKKVKRTPCPPL